MNANLRRTLIALTLVAAFGATAAYADDDGGNSVTIHKHVSVKSRVHVDGDIDIYGNINVNAAAMAVSQSTQNGSLNNVTENADTTNSAEITDETASNASGNIGVNQASGNFNAQGNNAAIAAVGNASSDEDFTFDCEHHGGCGDHSGGGMADAETFVNQNSFFNSVMNYGTTNAASIDGDAFENASGNVGVNQVAGDDNEQLNTLAAATASNNVYALATSTLDQEWSGNSVDDEAYCNYYYLQSTSNSTNLSGNVASNFSGNLGLNQAAGVGNLQSNSLSMAVSGQ